MRRWLIASATFIVMTALQSPLVHATDKHANAGTALADNRQDPEQLDVITGP